MGGAPFVYLKILFNKIKKEINNGNQSRIK